MTNKQIMKNKIESLEKALLEADFMLKGKSLQVEQLQKIINNYKKTNDPKDLIQNNEAIMNMIQARLDFGASKYLQNVPVMPEDDITRDMFYEGIEEVLDLSIYLGAFMLRLMKYKEILEDDVNKAKKKSTTPVS